MMFHNLCGPEEMILAGKDALLSSGMEESKIKFELFTTSSPAKEEKVQAPDTSSSSDHVDVAVVLDGVTTTSKRKTYWKIYSRCCARCWPRCSIFLSRWRLLLLPM